MLEIELSKLEHERHLLKSFLRNVRGQESSAFSRILTSSTTEILTLKQKVAGLELKLAENKDVTDHDLVKMIFIMMSRIRNIFPLKLSIYLLCVLGIFFYARKIFFVLVDDLPSYLDTAQTFLLNFIEKTMDLIRFLDMIFG